MPKIFISYRRADSAKDAGRIHDRLIGTFRHQDIFKDVDDIPPGRDFRRELRSFIEQSDVMLVLIGKQWLELRGADGQRRLDDPDDWVRFEIAEALKKPDLEVIPALLAPAQMPSADDLPEDIRGLAYRNAVVIRDDPDFHRDMERLIEQIRLLTKAPPSTILRTGVIGVAVVAVVIALLVAGALLGNLVSGSTPAEPTVTEEVSVRQPPASDMDAPPPDNGHESNAPLAEFPAGHIAFARQISEGNRDIFLMESDGNNEVVLIENPADDDYPVWSPDSRFLVFQSDDLEVLNLYFMEMETGDLYQLIDTDGDDFEAAFAPDGETFYSIFDDENMELRDQLWVNDFSDSSGEAVIEVDLMVQTPHVSPVNENMVAFYAFEDGADDIYIYDAASGEVFQKTEGTGNNRYPVFSPDGHLIVFTSNRSSGDSTEDLFIMDADGDNVRWLTASPLDETQPSWSPDGEWIIYTANLNGNYDIFAIPARGGEPIQLTDTEENEYWPRWQP